MKKIFLIIIFVIFPDSLNAKNIYDTEIKLIGLPEYTELCESDFNFWKFVQSTLPQGNHLITCFVEKKIAERNELPDGFQVFSIGIPDELIRRKILPSNFRDLIEKNKKTLLDLYSDKDKKKELSKLEKNMIDKKLKNNISSVRYLNVDFLKSDDVIQSWIENVEYSHENKSHAVSLFKAFLLIKGKVIYLSANNIEGESINKFKTQTTTWINNIIEANQK